MKAKKIKKSSVYIFFVVLYCFYTYDLRPYFLWDTFDRGILGFINQLPMRSIIGILVIATGTLSIRKQKAGNNILFAGIVLVVLTFSLFNNSYYLLSPNWLIVFATMIYVMSSAEVKKNSYIAFYNIFLLLIIVPIIIYILVHLGVKVPYSVLDSYEDLKQATNTFYKIYPLACQWTDPWNDAYRALRMCGVYSEPGVVGTFCALFLCAESFQLKGNWKNIVMLIGGILSFSLAFYLIVLVYIIWRAINVNWKYGAAIIGLVIIYIVFMNIQFKNPIIANFQSRLLITSAGLSGNNRTNIRYDQVFNSLGNEGFFRVLFGKGYGAIEDILSSNSIDGASYKNLIYNFGIIGFVIQLIWFFAISYIISKGKEKKVKIFCFGICLVLCANMYQRPTMFGYQYLVVLFGTDYCYMSGIQASKSPIVRKNVLNDLGGKHRASNKVRFSTTRR